MLGRTLAGACAVIAVTAGAVPAAWSAPQTWVSSAGSDAGTCGLSAPCRTLQFALARTNDDGTLFVLTPGSYGPMNITRSVNVIADGTGPAVVSGQASFNVTGAVLINAPDTVVRISGLTIDRDHGGAGGGIAVNQAGALHVENCTIQGSRTGYGILWDPDQQFTELHVTNTTIFGNDNADSAGGGGNAGGGILVRSRSAASVVLDDVRIERNHEGIRLAVPASFSADVTIRDSMISQNDNDGFIASGAGRMVVNIDHTTSSENGRGIVALGANIKVYIGDSTITDNLNGFLAANGAVIASYGTNKVNANSTDGSPTITIPYK